MKKKKLILKFLKNAFLFNILLLSVINVSFAQDYNNTHILNYSDMYRYFNKEFDSLLINYTNNKESLPLSASILDSSNPMVKGFIVDITKSKNDEQLAMYYFPKYKFKNKDTSFCLIFYDAQKDIFNAYEKTKIFSKQDALQYLSWHEIGHCFAFHEKNIRDGKKDEAIADTFAISLALNQDNPDLAFKILKEINLISTTDIHANGEYLQTFLSNVVKEKYFKDKKNINQILKIIFYYNEFKSFQNFKIED